MGAILSPAVDSPDAKTTPTGDSFGRMAGMTGGESKVWVARHEAGVDQQKLYAAPRLVPCAWPAADETAGPQISRRAFDRPGLERAVAARRARKGARAPFAGG